MSQTYPLVCTKGVIIFPDQEIVIDVGREASLKAVENARDNYEDKVVLFSQVKLQQENPTFDDIYHVGTLCEIRHVRKFENFLRIKFRGLDRVELKEWSKGSLSDMGTVDILHSYRQDEVEEVALVRMIAGAFEALPHVEKFLSKELMIELSKGIGADVLSDKAVQTFPLLTERKQEYLETLGINDRLEMLLADMQAVAVSSDSACSTSIETEASDYFLLTPGMRCDVESKHPDPALSLSVQEKTQQVLNKLSRLREPLSSDNVVNHDTPAVSALEPALTEWLNTRLPEILEHIVSKELQKALKK